LASCCGSPMSRNSVLEELRVNKLAVIQEDICWRGGQKAYVLKH